LLSHIEEGMQQVLRASVIGFVVTVVLGGCSQLAQVGQEPEISPIENPSTQAEQRLVSVPLPEPERRVVHPGSLFQPTSKNFFFRDQRAYRVGDILTVLVNIDDQAEMENETQRSRESNEDLNLSALLGYESTIAGALPDEFTPEAAVDLGSDSSTTGTGQIDREEEINIRIAATVTQKLPNGNFVIAGRQEVRVNFELRELRVAGIIRPEDITAENTVNYSQIAEARISYGGRGDLSDVQRPRYGQQVLDILLPF
jgi:flagellar L-ring protein precursor FlgH